MDDETFNKVVNEVSSFYRTITTPFLNRMSDHDRENAVLWSQKIMDLKNYESLTKYLTYLTFMIINGRLVTPFDSDPRTSQIPPLPVHMGETKMLDFIEKVVAQCQSVQDNQGSQSTPSEISAAVSNDELAFIATQPTPGVGIRLYLATSSQPFSMWSKAEGTPQAVKYNVPAREVIDRGLAVAKEKFYSYLDEIEKLNKESKSDNGGAKRVSCQRPTPAGNVSINDTSKSTLDGTVNDTTSDFESSNDVSNQSESRNGSRIPRQTEKDVPQVTPAMTCTTTARPSGQDAVPGTSGVTTRLVEEKRRSLKKKKYLDDSSSNRPAEPLDETNQRRDAEVEAKFNRWFSEAQYKSYREEIRGFLKGGTKIDTIRRAVHSHIRQRYNPCKGEKLPLYAYDSEDESVPFEIRTIHLRERYANVLQNEYGIVDEAELYYLLGIMGLSEKSMEKARELIKYAEEGLIDDKFREKFRTAEGRTFGRLIPIIEELVQSISKPSKSSTNTSHVSVPAAAPQLTSDPSQSTIDQAPTVSQRQNGASNRHMRPMPPTSVMDDRSEDTIESSNQSNQSNIENEPEPEFFQNIEELDDSTDNTSGQPNTANNTTHQSSNQNQSEQEPDGKVYPYCPRENCD